MLKKTIPLTRGFYSFDKLRAGDFILYVKSANKAHEFIYFPGGDFFYLTFEDFSKSIDTNIITFVEQLPEDIFDETINFSLSNHGRVEYNTLDEKQNRIP
jgi:hypothetical protein